MPLLHESLSTGTVEVQFIKADGTLRTMLATTNSEIVSSLLPPPKEEMSDKPVRGPTPGVYRVFDLEKNEFRSFKEERLIGWTVKT